MAPAALERLACAAVQGPCAPPGGQLSMVAAVAEVWAGDHPDVSDGDRDDDDPACDKHLRRTPWSLVIVDVAVTPITSGRALLSTRRRLECGRVDSSPLLYNTKQLCVADDGFVFVADCCNTSGVGTVTVLTSNLAVHSSIDMGQCPCANVAGVCVNKDVVVVSRTCAVSVFHRSTGLLVDGGGCCRCDDMCGSAPTFGRVCFLSCGTRIASLDVRRDVVHVCYVDGRAAGTLTRHICVGGPSPHNVGASPSESNLWAIACSPADEIVVAGRCGIMVLSDVGVVLKTLAHDASNVRDIIVVRDSALLLLLS